MSNSANVVHLIESNKDKFFSYNGPLPAEELVELEEDLSVSFPDNYRNFLLYCDGGDFTGDIQLSLFDIDEVYRSNTELGRNLRQDMPGMIFFGHDYGDVVFYFDSENYLGRGKWAIYSVGLGSRSFEYSKYEAQNFTHLIQRALNEEGLTDGPFLKDEGYYPRPD